jgi:putative ABC transport system permease protein
MKLTDIVCMAIHNLWQRRLRTTLNLIGVVIGCIILLMTAAGAGGVEDAIQVLFDSSEFARQIGVFSGRHSMEEPAEGEIVVEGEMSDERRERIHQALVLSWKREFAKEHNWMMTRDTLAEISKIPHVTAVVPEIHLQCTFTLDGEPLADALNGEPFAGNVTGIDFDSARSEARVIMGEMLTDETRDEALLDEYMAYRMGYRSDAQLESLIGREISVQYQISGNQFSTVYRVLTEQWDELTGDDIRKQAEFMAAFVQLLADLDSTSLSEDQKQIIRSLVDETSEVRAEPESLLITKSFRVRGIVQKGQDASISNLFRRYFHDVSPGGILLHPEVAADLQTADPQQDQFYQALVTVDSTQNLQSVTDSINEMGGHAESGVWLLESINRQIRESSWIVYGIAAAVLLTSAIGISNTLIISVLERTPEFGIMKSVGARDSQLVLLMVCEGAVLGFVGATVAIVLSLVLALVGHRFLENYVEAQVDSDLTTSLFQFSVTPAIGVVLVAVVICVAASILPAWRAARLDPVTAMRRT